MSKAFAAERRFLDNQAATAKNAMVQTLRDLRQTAVRAGGLDARARQHPWLVAGSAVAAGFITGVLLTRAPRKREDPQPQSRSTPQKQPAAHESEQPAATASTWFSSVGTALTLAMITVLQGALTSAVASFFPAREESGATTPTGDVPSSCPGR
jgi:hypothetical protein